MSSESDLTRNLHLLLSALPNAPDLSEVLEQLDARVQDITSAEDFPKAQHDFEEELQVIYDKEVDHSHIQQLEIFLASLFQCRTILPSVSIISTWFDLLLRPALREPRLSSVAVEHAKQLILQALEGEVSDKLASFRRRLLDLFLLDVLNESSGKDIFEWAELDEAQREKNSWWKNNLEDVLVRYGLHAPEVSNIRVCSKKRILTVSVGVHVCHERWLPKPEFTAADPNAVRLFHYPPFLHRNIILHHFTPIAYKPVVVTRSG